MSRTNKWGPALGNPAETSSTSMQPTDIAAAIAAGLSVRLGSQPTSVLSLPQQNTTSVLSLPSQNTTAEFEINDSPIGKPDLQPNERKLHLFLNANTAESLRQAIVILEHCYKTGFMVAQPQPSRAIISQQQQFQYQQPQQLPAQFQGYPSQFVSVAPLLQLQPQPQFSQLQASQYQQFAHPPLIMGGAQQNPQLQQYLPGPLNLHQHLTGFNARVSLGALTGPGVDHPGFSVKHLILGSGGQNVRHILATTGATARLKGRGATLNVQEDGPEDMYIHLTANSETSLRHAVELATNLVETVRQEYMTAVTQPLQPNTINTNHINSGQPNGYGTVPYLNRVQSAPLGKNGTSGHFLLGSGGAPSFQPPPQFGMQSRPTGLAPSLQHPTQNQNNSYPPSNVGPYPEVSGQSKGCVPFLYPDGDAIVKAQQREVEGNRPSGSGLHHHDNESSANRIPRRQESLQYNTSSSNDDRNRRSDRGDDRNNGGGRNDDRNNRGSRDDDRNNRGGRNDERNKRSSRDDDKNGRGASNSAGKESADSSSSKRRRGFQESVAYTEPTECSLPTSVLHAPRQELKVAGVSGEGHGHLAEKAVEGTVKFPVNGGIGETSKAIPTEPTPSVVAALAAMNERRIQSKAARPIVPAFASFSDKPPVPIFNAKPPVPSFSDSSFGSGPTTTPVPTPNILAVKSPVNLFKLPGLIAYEDDDDDDN